MAIASEVVAFPVPATIPLPSPVSLFHQMWPLAGLIAALVVNAAWIGLLGFGFFKLMFGLSRLVF